ncbi:MAG: outer membrane protein assembly factor BamD [Candidatus Brocadiia bacterium]
MTLVQWTRHVCGCLLVLAVAVAGTASGMEVWMPETGEVQLEEMPRDTLDARRRHAYALLGAGQWAGGIRELRALIRRNPDAPWVPEARLLLARALAGAGKRRKAFNQLAELQQQQPDTPLAVEAWSLQRSIARQETRHDLNSGLELYDRLIEAAPDELEAADLMRAKGDAAFKAERYLLAQDEYLALVSFYPRSEWVPYCWYKIAECEWQMATWLGLGLERVVEAERSFEDFVGTYPQHEKADDARQMAAKAHGERADRNADIVRFYIEGEKKPWAAVTYLEYLRDEFPDSPEAAWAEDKLKALREQLPAPTPGRVRMLALPGVEQTGTATTEENN